MSGLNSNTPTPTELRVHTQSRLLEVHFDDGVSAQLSHEFLRVHSPSAEVRGHGAGQAVLQTGKRATLLTAVEPVGNYALRLIFSDVHAAALYAWAYPPPLATTP